jgi:putative transposase
MPEGRGAQRSHHIKVVKPSHPKNMPQQSMERFGMSIRLACITFSISETCYRYQAKLSDDNVVIAG